MVKLLLKFVAGVNVSPASRVFTSAIAPLAVQAPPTNVEVTEPEVPVFNDPAAGSDSVKLTVTFAQSTTMTTMKDRFSAVSSV